jgi:hypothetical protein
MPLMVQEELLGMADSENNVKKNVKNCNVKLQSDTARASVWLILGAERPFDFELQAGYNCTFKE